MINRIRETTGYHLSALRAMAWQNHETELMPAIKHKKIIAEISTVRLAPHPPISKIPLAREKRRVTSALISHIHPEPAKRAISKLIYEYIYLNKALPYVIATTGSVSRMLARDHYHAWCSDQWGTEIRILVTVDPAIAVEGSIVVR